MCADPKLRTRLLRELAEELAAHWRDHAAKAVPGNLPGNSVVSTWRCQGLALAVPAAMLAVLAAVYF